MRSRLFGLKRSVLLDRILHSGAPSGNGEVIQGSEYPGNLSRSIEIEVLRMVSPMSMTSSSCVLEAILVHGGEELGDG